MGELFNFFLVTYSGSTRKQQEERSRLTGSFLFCYKSWLGQVF
jgi:hypothetical protein